MRISDQFGFLRQHSSVHALGRLRNAICEGMNNERYTASVSLDLKAAFDTVWHQAIVFKLSALGFPLMLIKIVQNILRDRTFAVKVTKLKCRPEHHRAQ